MQQNIDYPEMASPYMLWEYVQLMTPMKAPDYNIHPAFTHTAPHLQSMTYIQDQLLGNANYRRNIEQNHHHHHQAPNNHHFDSSLAYDVHNVQNERYQLAHNENQLRKKHGKPHTNCNGDKILKTNHISAPNDTPRILAVTSPKKISTFTIDAILSKGDNCKQLKKTSTSPLLVMDPTRMIPDPNDAPVMSAASTPPKMTSRYPLNSIFTIPQPLMHSTPISHHSHAGPKRHSRFLEVSHPHPYFAQQYDSHDIQQLPHSYQHHSHILPPTCMTSSSSSVSSSGSLSTPSSTSTSPESTATSSNEKSERRSGVKSKRIRTIFTPEQLERLEAEFERQQYMVGNERFYLATSLNLTEAQVKVWFQNRRIKWRKQHLEQQHARLAQGDLYRDMEEESVDSDTEEPKVTDLLTHEHGFDHSIGEMSL